VRAALQTATLTLLPDGVAAIMSSLGRQQVECQKSALTAAQHMVASAVAVLAGGRETVCGIMRLHCSCQPVCSL
jgi:hypothetical protein